MSRIFISHSSVDKEQAAQLLQWLHAEGFASTFLDFDENHGIAPGANWEHTLYRELSRADAVILIMTKNWFESKWCFVEFAQARALGKAVFPLVESPTGEKYVSSDIQHLDLIKDREGGLEKLRAELTRIAINTRGGFSWDGTRSPFPGLFAFDEADAAIYFGRDDDIRRLIERLNARRAQGGEKLVVVLGASGAGKSSLIRAGVVPRLKRDKHNWIVLPPFRPGLHPLDELAQAMSIGLRDPTSWRQWRAVFEAEDPHHAFSDVARDLRASHEENEAQILIVIDQGEELFGGADGGEGAKFLRVLSMLLDERLPFLAVMALRSDYFVKLQEANELAAEFEQFSLKPMPLDRVREIIEGPAAMADIEVDDELIKAAVADARTDDALPLLAFALRELYERSQKSRRLTVEAYQALGDVSADLSPLENAARKRAEEVLGAAKPNPDDLQALKESFIPAMVRVNLDGEYVRRPANMASLPRRALPLLEGLAKARLLTIRKEPHATVVEVTHEALLRKWPLLRGWLDEEREFLVGKDQLEVDLRDWERASAELKDEALLSGLKLTRARTWLGAKAQQLNEAERLFILASIARRDAEVGRRERSRRRVLRGSFAAAVVLALVAAGALWALWRATVRESEAVSNGLAMKAVEELGIDGGQALRDAIVAFERSKTDQARFALNAVLEAPRERFILHHKAAIVTAVVSPNGKYIVTASTDGTARIWDIDSGQLLFSLTGHTDRVKSAVFSPDSMRVATASQDHTARVWDVKSGRLLETLTGHISDVNSAVFSPDGKRIVTASIDHTAAIWDAESGSLLAKLSGHTDSVNSAAFSPDGKRIVTASDDLSVRVWDAANGHQLATLVGHTRTVNSASFSPDGKRIVTASDDRTARIWNAESGSLRAKLTGHTDSVNTAVFSPDGKRIATASWDLTARVWDSESGNLLATLSAHTGAVDTAAFSPDGKLIVTASADHTARTWDADSGRPVATFAAHTDNVNSAVFSPDGKRIVTASVDGTARIWDPESWRLLATLSGHSGAIYTAAYSPDGQRIVTANWDHTSCVWDAELGRSLVTLSGHTDQVLSAAFSPDGKRIVTASRDHTARVWDAGSGRLQATLVGHTDQVYTAVFSPDGKRIVTASADQTARIWDSDDGRPSSTLSGHTNAVESAAFSPDGKRIITASDDFTARIWDAETGRALTTLSGHAASVNSASFSPDGQRIVTASWDQTARVWDSESGQPMVTLSGHSGSVNMAEFSPDGEHVVTASYDHTARIWDSDSGILLATLSGHTDRVYDAVFSRDGKRIVTASADGTVNVYLGDFEELLKRAKQEVPVNFGN